MCLKKTISVFIIYLLFAAGIYSLETSEILWRYTTGGRINTPPVEGENGTIYFCSEDRNLYALGSDGTLLWRNNLEDRITETLSLGYDGTIYTGSKRGFFLAVNPIGEVIWKVKLKGSPFGNPAIAPDGSLFIVTNEGWFYSISHTGFIRWELKLPALPVLGPVLGANLYIALNNNRIYSYSIDGTREWVFLLSGNADSLVLSKNNIYAGTDNNTIVSINFSGIRLWNKSLNGAVRSIITLTENSIVCTSGNYLTMMDSEGNIIWISKERRALLDLAAYSNMLVTLDSEGYVSWFNLEGIAVSTIQGGAPVSRLLGAVDGSIYIGSKDWLFYKYGLTSTLNDNYAKYLWPVYGGGVEHRSFLTINKTDKNKEKQFRSSDYVYLKELSKSLDEKNLNELLDDMEHRLFNRDYDIGKSYFIDILEIIASECITRPLYEEGLLINDFPIIRSRAVDILGITGNFNTIDFLIEMLSHEWDSYAINSIIRSLGSLQSDKEGNITKGISNYYFNNDKNTNNRVVSQIILSIKKIDKYNGTTSKGLLSVITDLFLTSSSRIIKELALDTINSIKK